MEYRELGTTGITVSRLCFGTLTLGPLQAALSLQEGSRLMVEAWERGINFFDTAETYGNYRHIKVALEEIAPRRAPGQGSGEPGVTRPVIATKSYAYRAEDMEKSLSRALRGMSLDSIDLFLLHEQESAHTLRGHYPALEYLVRARERGYVRCVGISCHAVAAVWGALEYPQVQVIHPVMNIQGVGIKGGTREDMQEALRGAARAGVGLYGMKPLGGGHLLNQRDEALRYALSLDYLDSIALGMRSREEIIYNQAFFSGQEIPPGCREKLKTIPRRLLIHHWCQGCGECVRHCPQGALKVHRGKASLASPRECTLCGYCGAYCQEMCIKII